MMTEELTLKVNKERAYFSLNDNEGEIGYVELGNRNEGRRKISNPRQLIDHKEIAIRYNLYPNAKKRQIGSYKSFLEMSEGYKKNIEIDLGKVDRQTQMEMSLDLASLKDFINEMGADKRLGLTGVPEGEFGQFWVLNLRILNPSQVQLI